MILARLADLAGHLPADWRAALGLDGGEPPDPATPVLWHQGDLALPLLALDALPIPGTAHDSERAPWLLWVQGDLQLEGALLASETGGNAHLLVSGALHARQALLGPGLVAVGGALRLQELLWGDGANGRLHVGGAVAARWALLSGGYAACWQGPADLPWWLDAAAEAPAPGADPTDYLAEALAAQLRPEGVNGLSDGQGGPGRLFEHGALRTLARAGEALLREPGAVPGLLPRAEGPCAPGSAVGIETIRALVHSPLIARRAHRLQDWFGDTDYALCRRHVDAGGDQREDSVFITVWRRWDFYFEAGRIERPRGLLGRVTARLGLRDAPLADELTLLWRRYDDSGTCGEWRTLDDAAPADAHAAASRAWQAVLTHASEGLAQVRTGYPLWGWLQRSLPPARVQALAQLPVFTEEYNDWWDSDRNGFWERDIWVGARQPGRRGEHSYSLGIKLSWETGPSAPGDGEDNNHASYLLELESNREGTPWLRFTEAQRQDSGRAPLLHHSATHVLRLARMFGALEQRLLEREALQRAQRAETERAKSLVRLLARPPVPDTLPDAQVFPAALLELSARWQQQGRDYVAAMRRHCIPPDATEAPQPSLPDADPRGADAAIALQLARVVHRCHDPGLSRRLRQHFAFAPNALLARSREAGRCVSAVFLLDAERLLVRIGEPGSDTLHWMLLTGLWHSPLPRLRGAGRSPDGRCWALCEDGELSTRRTLEGPAIARFPLPPGEDALARRCDQLVPSGDGQRVLLRNPTGGYLLSSGRVEQLPAAGPAMAGLTVDALRVALPDGTTVVGDADGYLHAIGPQLETLWRHHVGSAIASVDASPDGRTLVASSHGGYLVGLQRSDAGMDPFNIGTSPYEERWRWIFWDGEDGPLRW